MVRPMRDLASELNEQQLAAVSHGEGPLLVIAGAGSGKTRVITYRIANLIHAHGIPPWRIMAVTFTNKAAKEMAERVERLVGADSRCWISTFHAGCARILRTYGDRIGVDTRFTIYDDQDQKAMVARVLKELNMDPRQFPPRAIASEINRAKQELIGPADYAEGDFYRRHVKCAYELYEQRMQSACALDFGDLLYRTVRAMQDNPSFAAELAGRFDHLLVDEFQDTNRVQLELVRYLTPHRNICVVGDDDQSIYSWRGADVTNILGFENSFPGARVVTLDRNYRSSHNILKGAHGVVSRLPDRRPKTLWTTAEDGDPIRILAAPDEREEGRFVARKLKELEAAGIPLREQVVFYRTNAQSRVFEEVLRAMNIPHRVVGGMRFYDRAEVKDLVAYLRLILNPADHAAFVRVVNTPARGIGKTTVDKLVAVAAEKGISAFEAIEIAAPHIGGAPARALESFRTMVHTWRAELAHGPSHLIHRVVDDTKYLAGLEAENTAEADARIENIKELIGSVEDFEKEAETPGLDSFLELVALQTDVDAVRFDGDQATLMTVHAAKGLEFDVVFVTGMEDGLFPLVRQDDVMLEDSSALDEERRLGYVAMTRARKKLFLTRATTRRLYGNTRTNPPSRFFRDIPPAVIQHLTAEEPAVTLLTEGHPSFPSRFGAPRPRPSSTPSAPARSGVWVDRSFDQSPQNHLSVMPGQEVGHPRYGRGKVLGIHPGANPKADILFPAFGRKTILVKYLELE